MHVCLYTNTYTHTHIHTHTQGSLTTSNSVTMLGPPLKFSNIFISRFIFFFLTGCKVKHQSHIRQLLKESDDDAYLQYFDNTFFIIAHVHGLKHFTILPSTQFPHHLVVVLVTVYQNNRQVNNDNRSGLNNTQV